MSKTTLWRGIITLLLLAFYSSSQANPWAMVTEPVQIGPVAQSIGTYNGGCLSGAVSLPPNGTGYQVMRLSRHRVYGHPDLKRFIEQLGRTTATQGLGVLLIGDMGQPRGGPTLNGHRSHQTGLDVDIWFLLSKQAENRVLSFNERETWSASSVLVSGSENIDYAQWSLAHEKVLEAAARMPEVDRIFVNPSVKRELCMRKISHDWLRKIRPWWKHDDHFHVRLKCPAGDNRCIGQEPLPQGDGCDAGLAWWFSAEAKKPATKKTVPDKAPELPALCAAVLRE
ncbi:MAG: penicillin-insensitive murein endopeptidase [Methylovulum sp.]|nr:penicillin-insensitive murein endopeptidase [Methylovulum sp.]